MIALFQPAEVKECHLALRRIQSEQDGRIPALGGGTELIIEKVKDTLKNSKQVIDHVRHKGVEPRTLVLRMLRVCASRELESGRHHTYRSALGFSGTELMQWYRVTTAELLALGDLPHDRCKEEDDYLSQAIKEVG